MNATRWDDFLVAEHELIERAMAVLGKELEALTPGAVTSKKLGRAIDFLLQFGDKVHNVKEERFLFPLLERRGIPTQGGPIAVMLREHEAERGLLGRMLLALHSLATTTPAALGTFKQEGHDYLQVRAEHIWKENDVLYAMGRNVLSEDDNLTLLAGFERVDRETYGEKARAHFQTMVEECERGEARTRLIENLTSEQLEAILETVPFELTFVDAEDTVAYFNRLDKEKIFVRTRSVVGRKVDKCHPQKSVDKVRQIVEGFRAGTLASADFWIDFKGGKVLIRYFPVHNAAGTYLGVLEVTQEVGWIQKLEGQKTLLA